MLDRYKYILCLCLLLGSFAFSQDKQSEKPSILFLNIDDWNDWNSVLKGHPQAISPNLKKFAERSVTFTRAVCSSPMCSRQEHRFLPVCTLQKPEHFPTHTAADPGNPMCPTQ